jgi:hypothetical protein
MKINLHEDEINGEVQDGSVSLSDEFAQKLNQLMESFTYSDPVIPEHVLGPAFERGRLEIFKSYNNVYDLKWRVIAYYKDDHEFVIPEKILTGCYDVLLDYINKVFPELLSYPEEILNEYNIAAADIDFFYQDGLFSVAQFFDGTTYVKDDFEYKFSLKEFMTRKLAVETKYTFPYPLVFEPNFTEKFNYQKKKLYSVAKAYMKGKFEGHDYQFRNYRVHISPSVGAFDDVNKVMTTKVIHSSISYSGIIIDGVNKSNEIQPFYKREEENVNETTKYYEALLEKLKDVFKPHKITVY